MARRKLTARPRAWQPGADERLSPIDDAQLVECVMPQRTRTTTFALRLPVDEVPTVLAMAGPYGTRRIRVEEVNVSLPSALRAQRLSMSLTVASSTGATSAERGVAVGGHRVPGHHDHRAGAHGDARAHPGAAARLRRGGGRRRHPHAPARAAARQRPTQRPSVSGRAARARARVCGRWALTRRVCDPTPCPRHKTNSKWALVKMQSADEAIRAASALHMSWLGQFGAHHVQVKIINV